MNRFLLLLLAAAPLAAQAPTEAGFGTAVRTGPFLESYSFGSGLAFDRVTQVVFPISVSQHLTNRLSVDVGTAMAKVTVRTAGFGDLSLSGLVNTDVRASYALVPGRVVATLVGTIPTGKETVSDTTLPVLGAIATDLLDFTVSNFGNGGAVSGGLASVFQLGQSWALGTAVSYRRSAGYVPVLGGGELRPGDEGRVRVGVEGPLAGGRYFRGALVYSASAHDALSGGSSSITGDRVLLYTALSAPLGRGSLSLYAWDMRRLRPRSQATFVGAIQVPRGNVVALGARLERLLSPTLTLVPGLEFRHELAGAAKLELLGYLVRAGTDLHWRLNASTAFVFQGQVAVGQLNDQGTRVSLLGPRLGALLEWTR